MFRESQLMESLNVCVHFIGFKFLSYHFHILILPTTCVTKKLISIVSQFFGRVIFFRKIDKYSFLVWALIRYLTPFRKRFTSLQRITDSLIRGRSTSGVQGKLRCLAIAITVYCIWLSRNKLIFEDYQFSVIEVISKIKFLMYRPHLLHLF